jgi:hypothetical protein
MVSALGDAEPRLSTPEGRLKGLATVNIQDPALQRDATPQDDLPADSAVPGAIDEVRRETVLLVHGTSANNNKIMSWWRPASEFCRKLDAILLERKSPARCWAHIVNPTDAFAWTGDNQESERRLAGESLAKAITILETTSDIDRYHIVAHSHGGNVALHALRSLAEGPKKLGAIVFLGTPVLSFWRLLPELSRHGLAILLYAAGLALSVIAFVYRGESPSSIVVSQENPFLALLETGQYPWLTLLAAGFAFLLSYELLTRSHRSVSIYGSGHPHAFEFVPDEAMRALRLSLEIARQPGDVLKQLSSTKATEAYAVDPQRDEFWKAVWSDFRTTAIYRFLKDSGHPSLFARTVNGRTAAQWFATTLYSIGVGATLLASLLVVLEFCIRLANMGPHLVGGIEYARSMARKTSYTLVDLFFGLALLCLTAMFFWRFLLVLTKLARLGLAWTIQRLLYGPGARIMGLVVRSAAFGGQCTQVLGPYQLPEKERSRRETISEELNQRMDDLSSSTATQAGQALYYALSEGDATRLRQHIVARLTDPELAHCQYYCEDEIVNRIADLIALPAPSTASADAQSVQSCHEAQALAEPHLSSTARRHP